MVSLSLMARLIEALRPDARLVLVGDPGQLASIEAGAVLGDIVGPAGERPLLGGGAARRLSRATGGQIEAPERRRTGSATGSSCSTASTASAAGSPTLATRSGAATPTPSIELLTRPAGRRALDRGRRRR